jgi:hypothetical protein
MTIIDAIVFVGLLAITDKNRRPTVFVGLLLITIVFALLR